MLTLTKVAITLLVAVLGAIATDTLRKLLEARGGEGAWLALKRMPGRVIAIVLLFVACLFVDEALNDLSQEALLAKIRESPETLHELFAEATSTALEELELSGNWETTVTFETGAGSLGDEPMDGGICRISHLPGQQFFYLEGRLPNKHLLWVGNGIIYVIDKDHFGLQLYYRWEPTKSHEDIGFGNFTLSRSNLRPQALDFRYQDVLEENGDPGEDSGNILFKRL